MATSRRSFWPQPGRCCPARIVATEAASRRPERGVHDTEADGVGLDLPASCFLPLPLRGPVCRRQPSTDPARPWRAPSSSVSM